MGVLLSRRAFSVIAGVIGLPVWAAPSLAGPVSFQVAMTGPQQVPPVETAATGKAQITYDPATRVVTWNVSYDGLSGPPTMAHFHGPAASGSVAPPVVWLTEKGAAVTGPIKGEATLTPEQAEQFTSGMWYINIHTAANPKGEIRGQVVPPKS
jgi:hypothetical protein